MNAAIHRSSRSHFRLDSSSLAAAEAGDATPTAREPTWLTYGSLPSRLRPDGKERRCGPVLAVIKTALPPRFPRAMRYERGMSARTGEFSRNTNADQRTPVLNVALVPQHERQQDPYLRFVVDGAAIVLGENSGDRPMIDDVDL